MTESAARIFPFKSSPRGSLAATHLEMVRFQLAKAGLVYHDKSAGSSGRQSTAVFRAIPNFESSAFTLSARQRGS